VQNLKLAAGLKLFGLSRLILKILPPQVSQVVRIKKAQRIAIKISGKIKGLEWYIFVNMAAC
jgi:hypothetical protein